MQEESLPDLININSFNGDWETYFNFINKQFHENALNANLKFMGLPISFKRKKEINGVHKILWHIITEDKYKTKIDEDRIPDFERCKRINWVPYLIKKANDINSEIKCWQNKRGRDIRVLLLLEREKFLVVLSKRREYYMLITMYCVREKKMKDLLKEHKKSIDPRL